MFFNNQIGCIFPEVWSWELPSVCYSSEIYSCKWIYQYHLVNEDIPGFHLMDYVNRTCFVISTFAIHGFMENRAWIWNQIGEHFTYGELLFCGNWTNFVFMTYVWITHKAIGFTDWLFQLLIFKMDLLKWLFVYMLFSF